MMKYVFMVLLVLVGCGPGVITDSPVNTALVYQAPSKQECQYGGSKAISFRDTNGNAALDQGEPVLLTEILCNGQSVAYVAATRAECRRGGTKIITYIDSNKNGKVDSGELVIRTQVVCRQKRR